MVSKSRRRVWREKVRTWYFPLVSYGGEMASTMSDHEAVMRKPRQVEEFTSHYYEMVRDSSWDPDDLAETLCAVLDHEARQVSSSELHLHNMMLYLLCSPCQGELEDHPFVRRTAGPDNSFGTRVH